MNRWIESAGLFAVGLYLCGLEVWRKVIETMRAQTDARLQWSPNGPIGTDSAKVGYVENNRINIETREHPDLAFWIRFATRNPKEFAL